MGLGRAIIAGLKAPLVIYLHGDLGAGKTTLVRGILRGLGYDDLVKSPTYTLVEEYKLAEMDFFHFDLYRLASPEELYFIGIEEYQGEKAVCCFEWPEKGDRVIAAADLEIFIKTLPEKGREIRFLAKSPSAVALVQALPKD